MRSCISCSKIMVMNSYSYCHKFPVFPGHLATMQVHVAKHYDTGSLFPLIPSEIRLKLARTPGNQWGDNQRSRPDFQGVKILNVVTGGKCRRCSTTPLITIVLCVDRCTWCYSKHPTCNKIWFSDYMYLQCSCVFFLSWQFYHSFCKHLGWDFSLRYRLDQCIGINTV